MELTGAQILMETLQREGVHTLFGYPGGAVIGVYDELARTPLKHILVRHEQAAVHAADGYARSTGEVGVCLVTSGPGATNAVTGIATAYYDSIPLVVLTGQVPSHVIGNDAFQEVDIVGITRSCTKHNYLVKDITKLASVLRQAFYLARTGRPGPVLVDLPKNVMATTTEFVWPEDVRMRSYNPTYKPNLVQLRRAADMLIKAERPLILAGGGLIASNGCNALAELAERFQVPVVSSVLGLGAFSADSPLWFGNAGMHGRYAANTAITEADLLIAVGTRFSDRTTSEVSLFANKSQIIHIDIDPTSIRKSVEVDVPVVADCKETLVGLNQELNSRISEKDWKKAHSPWLTHLREVEKEHPLRYDDSSEEIKPQKTIEAVMKLVKKDAIIATEVGQHQMWAAQFYHFTLPRTFITSGGLGTMGYGLPAAMGAQVANPDRQVILFAGDGSVQMNIQEMATLVESNIPVKIIILNNFFLGMVRQWQELFYDRNYSATVMNGQPDFVKLAEAYGAKGFRITKDAELESTLKEAIETPGPVIVDIHVAKEENVYPMVPAGAGLDQMLI